MDIRSLTLDDLPAWSALLAAAFERMPEDMDRLLRWMHLCYPMIAYGAWDGERLAAQYSVLVNRLKMPHSPTRAMQQSTGEADVVLVGMSVNMATHPDYRGRGLIKQVATPVYETLAGGRFGAVAGVGFSNAEGVQVDRKSKGYGYRVVGRLTPTVALINPLLARRRETLELTVDWPCEALHDMGGNPARLHFAHTPEIVRHRFAEHPFRRYAFGVWREGDAVNGVVIYRRARLLGLAGVSLLAAYGVAEGDALPELMARWCAALAREGVRVVHFLSTPHSAVRDALAQTALCLPQPYSRHPYFLTAKALGAQTPDAIFDLRNWDCVGGDVL